MINRDQLVKLTSNRDLIRTRSEQSGNNDWNVVLHHETQTRSTEKRNNSGHCDTRNSKPKVREAYHVPFPATF